MDKGDISFNVIIFAIIALLVLGILVYIVSTQSGRFVKNLNDCEAKNGKCASTFEGAVCPSNLSVLITPDCASGESKDGLCCFNPLGR